ncbi:response regulator transcription factor [Trinickia fusca]|uniref:DNA-binding response regulator n=1 Tax=Trinickia fusca TaxID=2419777 RepID=A0A494X1T8_9BURK|nr:response regulator [Trinickia fusca]RKP43601.1 DNA-binding response regulator [Trinickia fusca]
MSESVSRVFVVDDDAGVCRAFARLLRSAGYQAEVFESARSFLDCADLSSGPACVVLDLKLPDLNGLEVQRELNMSLPVIFVTGHGDIGTTVDAMKAGAADFLTKPVRDTVLLEVVERALARAREIFERRQELADIGLRLDRLTPREREVMALVVTGRLNKQIAGELGIAEKTIKIHRARVMEKMGAHSLADLIRFADKAGIGPSGQMRTLH